MFIYTKRAVRNRTASPAAYIYVYFDQKKFYYLFQKLKSHKIRNPELKRLPENPKNSKTMYKEKRNRFNSRWISGYNHFMEMDHLQKNQVQVHCLINLNKITYGLISWLCSISVSHSISVIIVKRIITMCNWLTLLASQCIMPMACMYYVMCCHCSFLSLSL